MEDVEHRDPQTLLLSAGPKLEKALQPAPQHVGRQLLDIARLKIEKQSLAPRRHGDRHDCLRCGIAPAELLFDIRKAHSVEQLRGVIMSVYHDFFLSAAGYLSSAHPPGLISDADKHPFHDYITAERKIQ